MRELSSNEVKMVAGGAPVIRRNNIAPVIRRSNIAPVIRRGNVAPVIRR